MVHKYVTHNAEETQRLAQKIADEVRDGGCLCLFGDLGSGKTTFTQGLARALGITGNISSPTFLLARSYKIPSNEIANQTFYHLDLYRLGTIKEIREIGLAEMLADNQGIVVIEWSEKLGDLLPKSRIELHFTYVDEQTRNISIKKYA